jgi:biopolymer transport protein ExbB
MGKMFLGWFQGPGSSVMWIVLAVGAISLGMITERIYFLFFKAGKGRIQFMATLQKLLKAGDMEKAIKFSSSSILPLAKVLTAILINKDKGKAAALNALDEVMLTEVPSINKNTPILMIIANISTLVGLLGTIYGLILSFDAIANVPAAQRATALALGISVAMGATLFGLTVAIPTMAVYGFLTSFSDRLVQELEEKSTKVLNSFFPD